MPCSRYAPRMARRLSLDDPMQDKWGAASSACFIISTTVSSVPCCVEPPAPNVTETSFGLSALSCAPVARNFSIPSCVFGGKNSNESSIGFMGEVERARKTLAFLEVALTEDQRRQQPGHDAVQNRAKERRPETRYFEAFQQRSAQPETQRIHDQNE